MIFSGIVSFYLGMEENLRPTQADCLWFFSVKKAPLFLSTKEILFLLFEKQNKSATFQLRQVSILLFRHLVSAPPLTMRKIASPNDLRNSEQFLATKIVRTLPWGQTFLSLDAPQHCLFFCCWQRKTFLSSKLVLGLSHGSGPKLQ